MSVTHSLYRFFDEAGALLYVGRTIDARSRWRTHERDKAWFNEVTRVEREVYPDAASLDQAERAAIRGERPRFNVKLSGRESGKAPQLARQSDLRARAGATVRALRELRGMKTSDLSATTGLSRSYLANIEAGRKALQPVHVARIAKALDVRQISILRPDEFPAEEVAS